MENDRMLSAKQLNSLFQYAHALCQQTDDAYDLLQSAMESYLLECKKKTIQHPEAFVRTVIRNRFFDQYRYTKRWESEPYEETASYDISPVDCEHDYIHSQQLEKIWAQISPLDRDILYHWAVLGYSTDECCEQLNIPRGSFLSRIHRLRKHWQNQGDNAKENVL